MLNDFLNKQKVMKEAFNRSLSDRLEDLTRTYEATKSGKCSGKCCEKFYLPFDPQGLEDYYETYMLWKYEKKTNGQSIVPDIEIIYPMLVYLGESHIVPETDRPRRNGEPLHTWTCRFFDTETRKCKIYLLRPHFCRTFPNYVWELDERGDPISTGKEGICNCLYKGCTFKHDTQVAEKIINLEKELKTKNEEK